MTREDCSDSVFDAQARIAELEHQLHDSESARIKAESTISKLKDVQSSVMDHFGQQLKDSDKKLEQEKSVSMGLELEIRHLKDTVANLEEPFPATGASKDCRDTELSASANSLADTLFPSSDEPRRKRVKLNHT